MVGEIISVTKTEVLRAIRNRYKDASKKDKSRMLDEFVAIVGCHRKHAVRLLRRGDVRWTQLIGQVVKREPRS